MALRSFVGLGWIVAGLAAGTPLGWWMRPSPVASVASPPPDLSAPAVPVAPLIVQQGPWGLIETQRVHIEPPSDAVTPGDCRPEPPQWRLKGYTVETFTSLLDAARVAGRARDELLEQLACFPEGCVVTPTAEIALGLTPEGRAIIYQELAQEMANRQVLFGFICKAENLEARLTRSGLSGALLARFRKLTYREGPLVRMSDAWALCAAARTPEERVRVAKTLARSPALVARLRIPSGMDEGAVERYWSVGGLGRNVRPLLDSVSREEGAAIGLADLLPPLARGRLDTFPKPGEPRYDCYWTSFNFFSATPDDRFLTLSEPERILADDYEPVAFTEERELAFGDLVTIHSADGTLQHAAVHIAGDVLFTKNGVGEWNPWILMSASELRAIYGIFPVTKAFRLKAR